jgi:hypothetical protein
MTKLQHFFLLRLPLDLSFNSDGRAKFYIEMALHELLGACVLR